MVWVLAKCGKISNVQVAGSAVTIVLKKDVPAVRKSCNSYHEKVVPVVKKSCDNSHEIAVTVVIRQLFVLGRSLGDFKLLGRSFHGFWLKNVKISFKGILLFWV